MNLDERMFLSVYELYKSHVYSCVYSYVQNSDDAAELTQEVFIKLFTANPKFNDENHRKAWLLRVAINICKNYLRDNHITYSYELPDNMAVTVTEAVDNDLFSIVLTLPEMYRIPLHLFYYEDYSVKEIANVMQIPESTVKVHLKRGRDMLKTKLNEEEWV